MPGSSAVTAVNIDPGTGTFTGAATTTDSWATWSYNWSVPSANFVGYTLRARATDGTNPDLSPASVVITVDNVAPTGLANSSPANSATGISLTPTLTSTTVTDPNPGTNNYFFEIATDTGFTTALQQSGWQPTTSWTPVTALQNNTVYYWRVKARDAALNETAWTATWSFTTVGTTPPDTTISAPAAATVLSGASYLISGTGIAGTNALSDVQVSTNNGGSWFAATGTTNWTFNWTLPAEDYVAHTLLAKARDNQGTPLEDPTPASVSIWVDTVAPTGLANGTPADAATNVATNTALTANTASLADNNPGGFTYFFEIDTANTFATGNLQQSGWQAGSSWTPGTTLAANTVYYWHVKVRDAAGNESAYTATRSFTTASAAPSLSITSPAAANQRVVQDGSYTVNFTLSDPDSAATVTFYYENDGNGAGGTAIAGCSGLAEAATSCSWDYSALTPGTTGWNVYGVATDGFNNVTTISTGSIDINTAPAAPADHAQYDSTGSTPIIQGASHNEATVVIKATVTDGDADNTTLEVEFVTNAGAFANAATHTSAATTSGSVAQVSVSSLVDGTDYKWQARICDAYECSAWTAYEASNPDVTILIPNAPIDPANLAQFESDGTTSLADGATAATATVVLAADLEDADTGEPLVLEVDLNNDGTADCVSPSVLAAGTGTKVTAKATCANLPDASYNWRVRVKDLSGATNAGSWQSYTANPDFVIASGMDIGIDTTAPTIASVSGVPGNQQVALSWSVGDDGTGAGLAAVNTYELKWGDPAAANCDGTGTFTNLNAYTVSGLTNAVTYQFRVCAYDKVGNFLAAGTVTSATPNVGDTTLVGDGTSPASVTAGPSQADIAVSTFDLSITGGADDTVTAVVINFTGSSNLAAATLYADNGALGIYEPGTDTQLSTKTVSGASVTFDALTETVTTTAKNYLVTVDIAASPVHAATVTAAVSSVTAGNVASNGDSVDATITIDAAGPTVSSTTPTNGATGVLLNQPVTITFNENVNCVTVDETTVTISPAVSWVQTDCTGATSTFLPSGQSGLTAYTVTVGTGIGIDDLYGNTMTSTTFSYTTVGTSTVIGDGVAPANKTVARGATNQAVSAFSLSTTAGTDTVTAVTLTGVNVTGNVAAGSVRLYRDVNNDSEYDAGDIQVGAAVSFSSGVASFSGLSVAVDATAKAYIAVIDIDAAAADGAAISASVTGATCTNPVINNDNADATITVDAAGPSVTATTPADGAINVTPNTSLQITWNDNVSCATVNTTNISISGGGTLGAVNCSEPTSSASIVVSGQANNQAITVTVGTGVTDAVGNAMAADYVFSYKTVDTLAPTSTVTAIGSTLIPVDFAYTITGTASDNATGTGVSIVQVNINGAGWVAATDTSGDGSWSIWSYSWANPGADGSYTILSRATDGATPANVETPGAGATASVDITKPTLNKPASNPAAGATGVTLNTTLSIVWSENIDCSTVNTSNITINGGATLGTVTCSAPTNTATIAVSGQNNSTTYTVGVANVADVAGNVMNADSYNYTTEAAPCVRNAPQLGVSANKYIDASETAVYTVTLINKDTNCGDTPRFDLAVADTLNPPGNTSFNASVLSAAFVDVASGATNSSVTLTVTSTAGAVTDDQLLSAVTISDGNAVAIPEHDGVAAVTATTTIKKNNPLVHNSISTGSSLWAAQNGWGVSGGQYGAFSCATCHTALVSESGSNIKRIRNVLPSAPDVSNGNFPGAGQAVVFSDVQDGTSHFGNDANGTNDGIANRSSSNRICEMCHTRTTHHRYDQTADYGSGVQTSWNHNNKADCISCHKHSSGFKADGNCDSCHGYPPLPGDGKTAKDGLPGDGEGKGAHGKHVNHLIALLGVTLDPGVDSFDAASPAGQVCGVCHWMDPSAHETGGNTSGRNINFNNSTVYRFGPSGPNYSGIPGTASSTQAKTCSSLACHFQTTPNWY